jgi:outer membrane lipoprotein-sorting protein
MSFPTVRALVASAVVFALPESRAAQPVQSPSTAETKATLREQLAQIVRETKTASWIHDSWETKDGKEEQCVSRCFWSRDGHLRMEVTEGHGAGSTIVLTGDRVTVRPFDAIGFFRLHYKVSDSMVLSVRGNDLSHTSFIDDLTVMLDAWDRTDVSFTKNEAVVSYSNRQRLPTRAWIQLNPIVLKRLESTENGRVVERTTYSQIHVAESLDPKLFEL